MTESPGRVARYQQLLRHAKCNLCGADDYEIVYAPRYELTDPDRVADTFRSSGDQVLMDQLVKCRVCGLQYLEPRLPEDVILDAYGGGTDERFVSQARAREHTFSRYLPDIREAAGGVGRVLDVGTAGGSFLAVSQRAGWDVVGCEPNRWLAAWGRQHYGIPIHPGTLADLKLPDESFDVVTLWDVLEHVTDPMALLVECRRVLRPDGVLVVNVPDIGSLPARLMRRRWVFLLSVHLSYFTRETLAAMLTRAGFQPIRYRRHWQHLELGYVLSRMRPYLGGVATAAERCARALRLAHIAIPYWVGQTNVLARKVRQQRAPDPV